jgi:hypothetical protein
MREAWWLNEGGVVAQLGRRGGSMREAWWLNEGGVVAQLGRRGGSMREAWWLNGSALDCCPAVPSLKLASPRPQLTANLLVGCNLGWHLAAG